MCTVILPPGDNPIAVNKYNIITLHLPNEATIAAIFDVVQG